MSCCIDNSIFCSEKRSFLKSRNHSFRVFFTVFTIDIFCFSKSFFFV